MKCDGLLRTAFAPTSCPCSDAVPLKTTLKGQMLLTNDVTRAYGEQVYGAHADRETNLLAREASLNSLRLNCDTAFAEYRAVIAPCRHQCSSSTEQTELLGHQLLPRRLSSHRLAIGLNRG